MSGGGWVVRLDAAGARAAARLRLVPGVEACEDGGAVWLRGPAAGEDLDRELRSLPGAERFDAGPVGVLRRPGGRVPCGSAPAAGWVPAPAWAVPATPDPVPAAIVTQCVNPRVAPSGRERPADVLRCPLDLFARWASDAPEPRLRPLAFAASAAEAVVVGLPLPPLPGARFYRLGSIAVPCGFDLLPEVGQVAWRDALRLADGDLALFATDASWERVPAAGFVRASRGAARASASP